MRIYKRGQVYWCEFRLDNKHYQYSCKTKQKEIAQEVASAIYADTIRNRFNLPVKNKSKILFSELFKNYMDSLINSPRTVINKTVESKHFLPFFGNKEIINITPADIKSYQLQRKLEIMNLPKNAGKREQDITFKSINNELGTLSNFFNFCVEKGYADKNPSQRIKKLNTLSRIKTLSEDDIQKLISGATNKLTRDLITFLIYTGCRKGEALNLKWDDLDLQNDVIAIKGTKTKYDRYIPISKPLKELLKAIEKNQDCHSMYSIITVSKSAISENHLRLPAETPDLKTCEFTIYATSSRAKWL